MARRPLPDSRRADSEFRKTDRLLQSERSRFHFRRDFLILERFRSSGKRAKQRRRHKKDMRRP